MVDWITYSYSFIRARTERKVCQADGLMEGEDWATDSGLRASGFGLPVYWWVGRFDLRRQFFHARSNSSSSLLHGLTQKNYGKLIHAGHMVCIGSHG